MPDRVSQSSSVYAFHDHRRKADSAYLDSPQRRACVAIYAKTLSSRAVRWRWDWRKGRRRKAFTAAGGRPQALQCLLKSPGFVGLIEPRVEQHGGAVTQRQDANDKKEVLAPMEKRLGPCGKKLPPVNSVLHRWWPWLPAMVEVSRARSNRPACGRTSVHDTEPRPSLL